MMIMIMVIIIVVFFLNNLNTNLNNIQNDSEHYARLIAYQNVTIGKLKKELTDKKKYFG